MRHFLRFIRHSLFAKIILSAGATLLAGCLLLIFLWTWAQKYGTATFPEHRRGAEHDSR